MAIRIKITRSIPEKGLQAGLEYDLSDNDAAEILANEWGVMVDALMEEAPIKKPRKKKEVTDGNG